MNYHLTIVNCKETFASSKKVEASSALDVLLSINSLAKKRDIQRDYEQVEGLSMVYNGNCYYVSRVAE